MAMGGHCPWSGGIFRNKKSLAAWVTTIIGDLDLGCKILLHSYQVPVRLIKTYFLPVLLIVIGLLWLWKYKKD